MQVTPQTNIVEYQNSYLGGFPSNYTQLNGQISVPYQKDLLENNLTVYINVATDSLTRTFTVNVDQKKIAKYLLISIPPILLLVLAVRFYYTFSLETNLIASFYSMQAE